MSLLTRFLDDATREALSKRETPGGMHLADVIRSGLRHPESAVGVYAPDFQSYEVFRELFDPILQHFRGPPPGQAEDLACLNPASVVSTRIRIARNLAGHAFPAGMSRAERLDVQEKILAACASLPPALEGTAVHIADLPQGQLDALIASQLAFGPADKYMAAAGIHADWPIGRSVFNARDQRLSVWINEEDHLRVAVVLPGACVTACHEAIRAVMSHLETLLEFCSDAQRGYLTSCPTNVGSAMRASYRVDLRLDGSQEPQLKGLQSEGLIQMRGAAGEHAPPRGGQVDVGFHKRVGVSEERMLHDMCMLLKTAA